MKFRPSRVALILGGVLALAAAPARSDDVIGRKWVLRQLGNVRVAPATPEGAVLVLGSNHAINGTASCNSLLVIGITWTGSATLARGAFRREREVAMPATLIGCGDRGSPQSKAGGQFWTKMRTARRWSVTAAALTITFADGTKAELLPAPD